MILTVKSYYFPKQHRAFVTFSADHKCLLWGTSGISVYYPGEIRVVGPCLWLSWLIACLSSRRPRLQFQFSRREICSGKIDTRTVFFRAHTFSVVIILPVLQTHTHLQGAVPPSPPPPPRALPLCRGWRHDDIKGWTWFMIQSQSATEIGWWLVQWNIGKYNKILRICRLFNFSVTFNCLFNLTAWRLGGS
jgi:hypothetical protein